MADGTLLALSSAGAVIGSSGCGRCLGRTSGVLAGSEISLSTANRNYRGRMGSPDAFIYIGSPYVAAVAALTGVIDDPRPYLEATEDELDALVARRRAERPGRGAASVRSGDRSRELMVAAARSGVAAEIDDCVAPGSLAMTSTRTRWCPAFTRRSWSARTNSTSM